MNDEATLSENSLPSWTPPPVFDLFQQYRPPAGFYDEMFSSGQPRDHWRTFCDAINELGGGEFARRWEQAQRLVHEHGIAYSAYGDPRDKPRPWQLDPLPLLISADEWQGVAQGLIQRAHLLNLVVRDLYGPQELLQRGLLPPEIVFRHPGFLRPCHGQRVPHEWFLHLYAADLARAPDGRWWVLGDRTEAPSGSGYALENRIVLSRMLPDVFRKCQVERLAPYFIALRETLQRLSRQRRDSPRVVLLSQGPESPNYFEDAYLARYLGYTLAQGDDLAVRNNRVMLKTLAGLLPVNVLLRRPNSDDCDPLELNGASIYGVAGLVEAARSGNVAVANALGSGLVESPVFLAFLPSLCRALLGEDLQLPGVATWWCGDPTVLRYVLDNLERLIVRPAFRSRGAELEANQRLSNMSPRQLTETIQANPALYVAQERVARSSTPVWKDRAAPERGEGRLAAGDEARRGVLESSHIALRAFLVASRESYVVMQGGLARVSRNADPLIASLLEGEGSKDVWVLSKTPVPPISLLDQPGQPIELRRSGAELPSRVADHVYWLGRQLERADAAARLLRAVGLRLTSETYTAGPALLNRARRGAGSAMAHPDLQHSDEQARSRLRPAASLATLAELPVLLRVLAEQGQIEPGYVVEGIQDQMPAIERALPAAVFDESQSASLRSTVNQLLRTASVVRDRISLDSWRIIHRIDEQFRPPALGPMNLSDLLACIDAMIIDLSAFSGMVMESMTRTHTWRFLDLGRRLERALQTLGLVKYALGDPANVQSPVLEAVLEVADSIMTYRSRYLSNLQLAPVLDLLLTDETNPRSVAYQLACLAEHVDRLPRDRTQPGYGREQRVAMAALHTIRMVDVQALAEMHGLGDRAPFERLLTRLETRMPELSDAVSHRYLIHAGAAHQLAELRPE